VNAVLSASHFVAVRDEASRRHLAKTVPSVDIQVVPDTAFSLSRFWPLKSESREFINWRESLRIPGPYAVIQADRAMLQHRCCINSLVGEKPAVVLPICWCHGDRADGFAELSRNVMASPQWLSPRLISEIIGRSDLVIASSLHGCITGLSYGVPVVRVPGCNAADRKFELLDEFEGVAFIGHAEAAAHLVQRPRKIETRVIECADRLDRYWDQVLEVVLKPHLHDRQRAMALMLGWATQIFGDIETAAVARALKEEHVEN
jgi:lipopolysaccharide transport system ATP-binding protein